MPLRSINSPKKFQLVLPTPGNINTFTPEKEAAFIFHRQILLQPTWINSEKIQNATASFNSPKKFQNALPTSRNINTKTMLPSFSIVKYFCNQLESSSKSNKIPLHKLIHEGNSIIFYLLLEILRAWLRKTKLPSFSIVKYFSNQLELTSKRDKIQLHQIIHERNSRIFYQLLDILKPRLWERSCHRSPPSNISANNLN